MQEDKDVSNRGPAYRRFRQRTLLATAALLLLGPLAALLPRHGGSLLAAVLWTAICSPVVVTIAITVMPPLSHMAASQTNGARHTVRTRR